MRKLFGCSTHRPRRAAKALLGLAAAAAALSAQAQFESSFSYAQTAFPAEFPGSPTTQFIRPFVARAYSSGNYLGFADERAYMLGPITGNQVADLGSNVYFRCAVKNDCGIVAGSGGTAQDLADLNAALARMDATHATTQPATGAAWYAFADSCALYRGAYKADYVSKYDSDALFRQSLADQVGEKRLNARILSAATSTNGDGSTRREIMATYDVLYADGSVGWNVERKFLSGSSFGNCSTPQTGAEMRWMGDGRAVDFRVQQRALNITNYNIADGTLRSKSLRREIRFRIVDPRQIATYAIVTGSGPNSTSPTGQTATWSLKFVSPRMVRSDPMFASKTKGYTNLDDLDMFRWCTGPNTNAFGAELADCATNGAAGGTSWASTVTQDASLTANVTAQDQRLANWKFQGTYTVKLYNDDGWKTVNGHVGKTPVATVSDTISGVPATFAQMANGSDPTGNMPTLSLGMTPVDIATALRGGNIPATTATFGKPVPTDGTAYRLSEMGQYWEGPLTSNATTAYWPSRRDYTPIYPGSTVTSGNYAAIARDAGIGRFGYVNYSVLYLDRNDRHFETQISFN